METTFHEIQKFNKWWHYLIAIAPMLLTAIVGFSTYRMLPPGSGTWAQIVPVMVVFFTLLTFIWFLTIKLETVIDINGIYVKFHGIPFCKRSIAWSEIKSISVIDYSPLSDYGGWGVRYGMAGNGWCYNVSGGKGIKLFYQDGKPFLVGTQQPETAQHIITHFFKPKTRGSNL